MPKPYDRTHCPKRACGNACGNETGGGEGKKGGGGVNYKDRRVLCVRNNVMKRMILYGIQPLGMCMCTCNGCSVKIPNASVGSFIAHAVGACRLVAQCRFPRQRCSGRGVRRSGTCEEEEEGKGIIYFISNQVCMEEECMGRYHGKILTERSKEVYAL